MKTVMSVRIYFAIFIFYLVSVCYRHFQLQLPTVFAKFSCLILCTGQVRELEKIRLKFALFKVYKPKLWDIGKDFCQSFSDLI